MSFPEEAKLIVTCPATGRKETVYCYYSRDPLTIIVNGCENSNASPTCHHCAAEVYNQLLDSLESNP